MIPLLLLLACASQPTPAAADPAEPPADEPAAEDAAAATAPVEASSPSVDLLALFEPVVVPADTSTWSREPPPELSGPDHTGAWYNGAGYRYYKDGDLPAAAALFARATQLDPDHALGHYNLACTLALIRTVGGSAVCEHGAYREQIFEALARAVELDSKRRDRMRSDTDLDSVRHSLRYELIDGADPTDPRHVHNMLVGTTLWGPGSGVWGSTAKLLFQHEGQLIEAWLDNSTDSPTWKAAKGSWKMDGLTVVAKLQSGTHRYTLDPGGATLVEEGEVSWLDGPSECEA